LFNLSEVRKSPNGDEYEWNRIDDSMDGNSTYFPDRDGYMGDFFKDTSNMKMMRTSSNGDQYEETFKDKTKHG